MHETEKIYIQINEEIANERADIALSKASEFSRSMIQKLIHAGNIKCDDSLVLKANAMTKVGQQYEITKLESNINHIIEEEGELNILFEDEYIIAINKQAGVVVHPGAGNWHGTMVNHLSHYLSKSHEKLSDYNIKDYAGNLRLGVVHRLDKDVSGCIIMAKTNQAHMMLASQFQERTVEKEYIALCYGQFAQNVQNGQEWEGLAEDYIGRSHIERKKMMCMGPIYSKNHEENIQLGKHSSMQYKIQDCKYIDEKTGFISRIQCLPKTGRMHQIRLQLAQRKLPIIGDALYGKKQNQAICNILGNRIGLHSSSICFIHPITKKNMKITSPLPESFDIIMKNN